MFLRNKLLSSTLRNFKVTKFIKPTTLKFSTNHEIAEGVALQHKFDTLKVSDIDREEFQKNLTEEQKRQMKRFDIFRFNPENLDAPKKVMSYYVDLKECGPMVLDALIQIKDEMDHSLTFRRSCREGICGSCSMNIDGRNTLACLSYIDTDVSKPSKVNPLPYFTVLKDLVVDMTNFYIQYKAIHPVLMRKTAKVIILINNTLERRTKGIFPERRR